jgi:hypothetical protein
LDRAALAETRRIEARVWEEGIFPRWFHREYHLLALTKELALSDKSLESILAKR